MSFSICRREWLLFLLSLLAATPRAHPTKSPAESPRQAENSLESHIGRGYEALKQENYQSAEQEFRAALELDPTLAMRARFPLAVALFQQNKFADARREFETVRRDAGDQPSIWYYLGRLGLEERNYKSAVAARPPFPDTAFYLGLAYLKLGSNPDAEKWLKEAVRLNPEDSRAEYQLATLYRKEGRQKEAEEAFQKSKQNMADSDRRSQLKRECGQELDRGATSEANSACEQLNNPNDADMLTALGILYGQHGQLEKALPPLQRAAELAPKQPQMQYNLAFTYFQLRRFQEAREPLAQAVERWPDLFPLNALYGAVLWNLGEISPAYQALHRAHQLNSQDAGTSALLYQSALAMAQRSEEAHADSEAPRYLQEAAALAPNDATPHERMAAIYRRLGKTGLAEEEERKAAEVAKSLQK
jgi:Flp pilus assembly protein TadD